MKLFRLPDLGEGLPDAIIREWYVKPGDTVKRDAPIVAMETAKALVDVPAPFDGKVEKCFGAVGETIETGQPLVGFEGEAEAVAGTQDSGTVVGAIEVSDTVLQESATGVQKTVRTTQHVKATPAVRALARQLGVALDQVPHAGERVTAEDVKHFANTHAPAATPAPGMEKLSPARRAMVLSMSESHANIVPVTLSDDADIQDWAAGEDFTVRMLRAITMACEKEPQLNSYYDGKSLSIQRHSMVNVGLAVDTEHGLFVPVIQDVAQQSDTALRESINTFKSQAQSKTLPPAALKGATIMLSNFGSLAGRYANPIIVPPMVAIVGVGRMREEAVPQSGQITIRRMLPLSLTIDHRAVTGGEAARFLRALMDALAKPSA